MKGHTFKSHEELKAVVHGLRKAGTNHDLDHRLYILLWGKTIVAR